ncbi:MAG: hypothetical protein H7A55_12510 [Verrucomicrobiaceae bacterium]|nr:hypothetical protein [Verrucomicrobiaceae bacterium]
MSLRAFLLLLAVFSQTLAGRLWAGSGGADDRPRLDWQCVQEYFLRLKAGKNPGMIAGTRRLNAFTAYTHLGTDFGFHGPGEYDMEWRKDEVCANLSQQPDAWAGMWHSLAGQARDPGTSLDFSRPYGTLIVPEVQPKISAVMIGARGNGMLKLEIRNAVQEVRGERMFTVKATETTPFVWPVSALTVPDGKFLNWTAEPGSDLCVTSLSLGVERPGLRWDYEVFLRSYAKLERCFDVQSGLVRDRSHLEPGAFDNVPATGLFALATAVASQTEPPTVLPETAVKTLRQIQAVVGDITAPLGLLPHFVVQEGGQHLIHPGTEYSSVDTAIYFHAMLLAAEIMGDAQVKSALEASVDRIDFAALTRASGHVGHGLMEDGKTMLTSGWRDWGGETALVMMLQRMANPQALRPPLDRPGQPWQGTGFIAEIQSLFYPDFNSNRPDAVNGVKWRNARRSLLQSQMDYIQSRWRGTLADELGIYGLSAGEDEYGTGYHVGGVNLPSEEVVFPHYMLMSAGLVDDPEEVYTALGRMSRYGFFPPWGLVENLTVTGSRYLPMDSALNAAFETIGAYHLMQRYRGQVDVIYDASRRSRLLRDAVRVFFPDGVTDLPSKPGSRRNG